MSRLIALLLMTVAGAGLGARHVDRTEPRSSALDVSVLLDASGSVAGPFEETLASGARAIQGMLGPEDKSELILFDREIRRGPDLHDPMLRQPSRIADGGTRLFDAIVTAALEKDLPGRRHVVVALTDGLDTASFVDRATRRAVLGRSKAVVSIVAISLNGRRSGFIPQPRDTNGVREEEGDYDYLLREITDVTGGRFYDIHPGDTFVDFLRNDLEHLRRSDVLPPAGAAFFGGETTLRPALAAASWRPTWE